jgi:hypothetical protein
MSQTPNVQVPLVYLDRDRAADAASLVDVTALQLAFDSMAAEISAAEGNIATLTATLSGLIAQVAALEGASIKMIFQPAMKPDQITMVWQQ